MDNLPPHPQIKEILEQLEGMQHRFLQWRQSGQDEILAIQKDVQDLFTRIEHTQNNQTHFQEQWQEALIRLREQVETTGQVIFEGSPTPISPVVVTPSLPKKRHLSGCMVIFLSLVMVILGLHEGYKKFLELWDALPNQEQIEVTSQAHQLMINKNKETIEELAVVNAVHVSLDHLPPYLPQAFIAIEDQRFYEHSGLDPMGMVSSLVRALWQGRRLGGGSTISQQTVKNLFFSSSRSLMRKLKESILSLKLEYYFTKKEILYMYLNNAYFGDNIYGIEAASLNYFAKHASDLNLLESALLAGAVKGPNYYNPQKHPDRSQMRARLVLEKMEEQGFITPQRKEKALKIGIEKGQLTWQPIQHHYFRDWIIPELVGILKGYEGHFRVMTTLDSKIQHEAHTTLVGQLRKAKSRQVTQGAILTLARDGAVLAMQGGVDFSESQLNRCTQSIRSPGSTLKTFLYLTALEKGMTKNTILDDSPVEIDEWMPNNFDNEYLGEISLEQAFIQSRNTVAVKVLQEIGIEAYQERLRRLGLERQMPANFTLALGTGDMTMLELATLYATLANEGFMVTPYAIRGILDMQGELIYWRDVPEPKRLVEEKSIKQIKELLEKVVRSGTGRRALFGKKPIYGKTGTSQGFRDAWFVGFTNRVTTAVWLGNDDNSPMDAITGGSFPAAIWRTFMEKITSP
ncbi:MAG: PBP1A family penicillin-binding protein [Nitrospirae bacterium]|nr:PBP1A family penicillin-binding protein [Magnetococcales bacterium]HAT50705.1 penicillin-binding protein [Alphaproteobacteria bacterium]